MNWSGHNKMVLSLKYASSSLAEEKSSLCWSAETFNIVISSQHCPYIGEENDAREFTVYELNSLLLESQIGDKAFDRDTAVDSPGSSCGSSEYMAELKERNDKVVQEKHEEDGDCYGQDVNKYPSQINECQLHDAEPESFFIQERDFKSGPENWYASTEPSKLKDQISNNEVNPDRNSFDRTLEFNVKDNCNAPSFEIPTCEDQVLAEDATPINKSSSSIPGPAVNGVLSVDAKRRNKKGKVEPLHTNQFCMVDTTADWKTSASKMGKGKGQITFDADDSRNSSNMREDGLENFASASSRRIISTVKRVKIDDSESDKLIGGKRLKRLSKGTCSGTTQDSSFINWVTNITNCLISPQDAHMDSSQHYFQRKRGGLSPLSILDEEREAIGISHGTRGFGSIFTALCLRGYNVGSVDNKDVDLNTLKGTDGKKPGNGYALHEMMNLDPHSRFPVSSSSFGENNKEQISNGVVKFITAGIASGEDERLEPMQSTFSRRLDGLKHANPTRFAKEGAGARRICLFCGMNDHSIMECSEVVATKLEGYLKSISIYDSIKKTSCFCILCLTLDHWAVECPTVSKGNQFLCNASGFSDGNIKSTAVKKIENHPSTSYDGAMLLWSGGRQVQHQFVNGSSVPQRFADLSNICCHKKESADHGNTDLCMDEIGGITKTDKMEVEAFCSQENELKRSEFASFHNTQLTTIMSEPKGIFLAVRKLQLSRKDILRWMKSSTPQFNIVGFYLRLRIGKPKVGLGATGYHVACINGVCCKSFISVCVGSSTYSVGSRFISNHDFDEDELNDWWFKKLREGSKMPTSEELNEKLQLRVKFGF